MNLDEARARHPAFAGRQDNWCALCVAKRLEDHGVFKGFRGLLPAVTSVFGTRVCGVHAEELLQRVLEKAELEARSFGVEGLT